MDEILLSRIRKEAYEQGYQDGKVDGYNLIAAEQIDLDKITEAHEKIGYGKGFRDGYAQAMEEAIKAVGINTWAGSRITQLQPAKFRERRDNV